MSLDPISVLLVCFLVALVFYYLLKWKIARSRRDARTQQGQTSDAVDAYYQIEPLPDFDWSTKEPLKIRAFKPMYHLTMGLTNIDVSSLVDMDNSYIDRILLRRQLMRDHEKIVLGAKPSVKPAVDEFYVWLLKTYLPTRYPTMFKLCRKLRSEIDVDLNPKIRRPSLSDFTHLESCVTRDIYPLEPPELPHDTLKAIGGIIDDDCQFLLPSEDGDGYALQGFVSCFLNGFEMSQKLGLKLRDIHAPVPHYREKLDKSMDRFFSKLEMGRFVRRVNWTISVQPNLCNPSGNHIYEGQEVPDDSEVDPTRAVLRCELQTLHRLPLTKALLFKFKTYTYPLQQIKDEGLGNDLAKAIDGMRDGSAPGIHRYKSAVVWGEKVKEFLRV